MPETLVIMPIYNAEKTIVEAINSVKNQTYRDFKLVCCDDSSTDFSLNKVIEQKRFFNLKVLKNIINIGTGSTVSKIIDSELFFNNYKYITWVSADNILNKDFLQKHVENLRSGCAISYSGWRSFDSKLKYSIFMPNEDLLLLKKSFNLGPSFVFTKKLYDVAGPFHRLPGEDFLFAVNCALNDAKFGFIKEHLVDYRVHENSVSGRIRNGIVKELSTDIALIRAKEIKKSNGNSLYT
jgi:glycosyltransferase involved in cell wall biosynthesis